MSSRTPLPDTTNDPRRGVVDAVEAVRSLARTARLLERTTNEITMAQYRVLAAVAAGEERASRVAERLELGRPAVSSLVEFLCREGYLDRFEVVGDQRAVNLRVTTAGEELLGRVESGMVAALDELLSYVADAPAVEAALSALAPALDALHGARRDRARERTS